MSKAFPDVRWSRQLRWLTLGLATVVLAACSALQSLNNPQSIIWYSLEDARTTNPVGVGQTVPKVLIIEPVRANPFYDSTQLAFSRSDIARAYYQFASWTERPAKRLAILVERRMSARNVFETVATSTVGLRGDISLNLTLDELFHDTVNSPEQARIVVTAELVDQRQRRLIARKQFINEFPIETPTAANAVRAMSEALSLLLDDLETWVVSNGRPALAAPATKTN
jgi:cholesterol transport system auxiliary component